MKLTDLTMPQRRILHAAAKDPRGNCPILDDGKWTRQETLDKLQEYGLLDSTLDLSLEERAAKDLQTLAKTAKALSLMQEHNWPAAHELLRELVAMTELRHATVWRITEDGRNVVEQTKRRKCGRK